MVKKQSHCQPSLWSFCPKFCSDFWKCHLGCWIWILESHNTEYEIQIFSRTTYWWIRSCRAVIERHCQSRNSPGFHSSILWHIWVAADEADSTKRRRQKKLTSIVIVPYSIQTTSILMTPLFFHCTLYFKETVGWDGFFGLNSPS